MGEYHNHGNLAGLNLGLMMQVFQEYEAAREAIFLYGGRAASSVILAPVLICMITRDWLSNVYSKICFDTSYNFAFPEECAQLSEFGSRAQYILGPSQYDNLISLLKHSRNCGASEKRDHIYAFLGLTKLVLGITLAIAP
jgi:hypothetical protein